MNRHLTDNLTLDYDRIKALVLDFVSSYECPLRYSPGIHCYDNSCFYSDIIHKKVVTVRHLGDYLWDQGCFNHDFDKWNGEVMCVIKEILHTNLLFTTDFVIQGGLVFLA